jgi:hypothetical protein
VPWVSPRLPWPGPSAGPQTCTPRVLVLDKGEAAAIRTAEAERHRSFNSSTLTPSLLM